MNSPSQLLFTCALLLCALVSGAGAQTEMPLWDGPAPESLGSEPKDIPTLTPFLADPAKATGAAMVVCPGGGYAGLAEYEGPAYAHWLNELGISAFVLKYRLGSAGYRHPAMIHDAARAVRTVRAKAAEWKIDPHRVGIIGSSAGGHLASTLLTHFDAGAADAADPIEREGCRPDLGVLCYPVISMKTITHGGSRKNLLGDEPPAELIEALSNELHVTHDTPPCFVWTTFEDQTVPPENSLEFAAALQKAGVPYDLHVYQKGSHGMGLGGKDLDKLHPWTRDCVFWLKAQGFVKT